MVSIVTHLKTLESNCVQAENDFEFDERFKTLVDYVIDIRSKGHPCLRHIADKDLRSNLKRAVIKKEIEGLEIQKGQKVVERLAHLFFKYRKYHFIPTMIKSSELRAEVNNELQRLHVQAIKAMRVETKDEISDLSNYLSAHDLSPTVLKDVNPRLVEVMIKALYQDPINKYVQCYLVGRSPKHMLEAGDNYSKIMLVLLAKYISRCKCPKNEVLKFISDFSENANDMTPLEKETQDVAIKKKLKAHIRDVLLPLIEMINQYSNSIEDITRLVEFLYEHKISDAVLKRLLLDRQDMQLFAKPFHCFSTDTAVQSRRVALAIFARNISSNENKMQIVGQQDIEIQEDIHRIFELIDLIKEGDARKIHEKRIEYDIRNAQLIILIDDEKLLAKLNIDPAKEVQKTAQRKEKVLTLLRTQSGPTVPSPRTALALRAFSFTPPPTRSAKY